MPTPGSEMEVFDNLKAACEKSAEFEKLMREPEKEMKALEEKVERKRLIEAPSLKEQLDAIAKAEKALRRAA